MDRSIDEELSGPHSQSSSGRARSSVGGLWGAIALLGLCTTAVWGDPRPVATDAAAAGGPPAAGVPAAATGPGGGDSPAARAGEKDEEKGEEKLQELVIVGSRFVTSKTSTVSPVVTVDASELSHQGTARAEDLLNSLPQLNAGLTDSANGAGVAPITGTATADLRGIGSFNTLVLMNGRRLQPGDSINPSPDLNAIPTALVKRVDVLTGGASSISGSDA
ncbi:MAG: TonB-dependent receptor, partial [Gammaproteobacteria bacterium]|nr:TonB-dependent receptor [Gammaproteobacteria bacterium]